MSLFRQTFDRHSSFEALLNGTNILIPASLLVMY
jgi:hypothetical protein